MVTPIIGFLRDDVGDLSAFSPDSNEVARVFTRSVSELLSPNACRSSRVHNKLTGHVTLPQWGHDDDEERIWGLTAVVLKGVLDQVLAPLISRGRNQEGGGE